MSLQCVRSAQKYPLVGGTYPVVLSTLLDTAVNERTFGGYVYRYTAAIGNIGVFRTAWPMILILEAENIELNSV